MKSAHWTDKTLAEVKADIIARIGLRHPFLGVDPSIVHEVVERLTSLERDLWAEECEASCGVDKSISLALKLLRGKAPCVSP